MAKHAFQVILPSPQDISDAHMVVYTQLEREWMEAVMTLIESVQQFEQDGASTDSIADRLRTDWISATKAMDRFATFAERHTRRLSPGPGGDPMNCILCDTRPIRDVGAELCVQCTVAVLTLTQIGG